MSKTDRFLIILKLQQARRSNTSEKEVVIVFSIGDGGGVFFEVVSSMLNLSDVSAKTRTVVTLNYISMSCVMYI
jgi:hypothetical protein